MNGSHISRRAAIATASTIATGLLLPQVASAKSTEPLKGRLKQSVCKWCYKDISLEDLCKASVEIGLKSIDLLNVDELSVVKQHGLICAMVNGPGPIRDGWNETARHDELVKKS